jgi:hypothetical protein
LTLDPNAPASVYRGTDGLPKIEVHSVRVARRRGFRESLVTDLLVEVRQRRRGYFDPKKQASADAGELGEGCDPRECDFRFRRGCTLIIDPVNQQVRYAIATRGDVSDNAELERVRRFLTGQADRPDNPFYGQLSGADEDDEHFAALHRRNAATPEFGT